MGADKTRNRFHIHLFSPSLRTASSLASDCQSEAVGLIVSINRTGREYSIRQRRDLDEAKILVNSKKSLPSSLDASQMPMYKGLRAGEGDSFSLPSPSLFGRFSLTLIYMMQNLCKMKCQSRIRTQRAQSSDLLQSCSHLGWVRIREWKREGSKNSLPCCIPNV